MQPVAQIDDEDDDFDVESPRSTAARKRANSKLCNEDAAFTRCDFIMLGFFSVLVVLTLGRMAWIDVFEGPRVEICDEVQDKISKHLHCVTQNNTKSFAEFLAAQGAKKEMPQYQKERERVRQQQLQRVGKSGAIATAAGRAADYLRAEAAKKGGDSLAYDDDGKEHDFYDPDVKGAAALTRGSVAMVEAHDR